MDFGQMQFCLDEFDCRPNCPTLSSYVLSKTRFCRCLNCATNSISCGCTMVLKSVKKRPIFVGTVILAIILILGADKTSNFHQTHKLVTSDKGFDNSSLN
ncbi:hypothetical protein EGR_02064 [Echinococcus granulosus]|uniref:Uncharacterized protein n=1 Tax=Echinococcus granulosus TaxID=6210 RepID=W6UN34_ECHGR|nr:hypothetical protein EGR_02064 [Echinococcus granulosus]EUB62970.1 hypothetical protein EGR_02064 [Echinococcus granulosus]